MYSDSANLNGAITELKQFPLFKNLDSAAILNLCKTGKIQVHAHRDILFKYGEPADHFAIVLSGAYKLSRITHLGEDSVIYFSAPGDVIAALVMPQNAPKYPVTACAMGPSRVLVLEREVYLTNWLANTDLIASVQSLLSNRMGRLQNQMVMQRSPLPSKIAALLMELVAKSENNFEMEVPLPLTRKEIADSLGVTVESVIRVMSDWAKQGLIITTDRHIRIAKPDQIINLIE